MGDFFKMPNPEEQGVIRGASRILWQGAGCRQDWKDLGEAEKIAVNIKSDPNDFDIDIPLPSENPITALKRWQRIIEVKASFEDPSFFEELIYGEQGKPQQISSFRVAISFDKGTPDPFYSKPPHTLREALRWIKDCALYPILLTLGRIERPFRTIYLINNLALQPKEMPPMATLHDYGEPESFKQRLAQWRREFYFKTYI